jgi:heat shock protein HslJ/membrane-bound inhibitor of C-type lysozyme
MFLQRVLPLAAVLAASGALLTACASQPQAEGLSDYGSYQCGQLDINVAGVEGSNLVGLEYLDRRVLLKPSASQTGALYVAPGDAGTRFWALGKRATLTLQGEILPECLEPGAVESAFEVVAEDPEWSARIENNRMQLVRPYDQQPQDDIWLTETQANRHGRGFEARLGEQLLELSIAHQLCETSPGAVQYPTQVHLKLDGETFRGCGGDRARLFRGVDWVVEDLAGDGIIDRSLITLRFLDKGRVAGRASCNRYFADYRLTDGGLSLGPAGATMMACAPALMRQERKFLEMLEAVERGRIGRQGELLLETGAGETIKAFPATTDNL